MLLVVTAGVGRGGRRGRLAGFDVSLVFMWDNGVVCAKVYWGIRVYWGGVNGSYMGDAVVGYGGGGGSDGYICVIGAICSALLSPTLTRPPSLHRNHTLANATRTTCSQIPCTGEARDQADTGGGQEPIPGRAVPCIKGGPLGSIINDGPRFCCQGKPRAGTAKCDGGGVTS